MFIVRVRATSDMEDEIFGPFSSPQWAKRFMERMEGRGLLMDLDHLHTPRLVGLSEDGGLNVVFDPEKGMDGMGEIVGLVYTDMNKMFLQKIEKDVGRVREICEIYISDRVKSHAHRRKMKLTSSDVGITLIDAKVVINFTLTKENGDKAPFVFAWERAAIESSEDPITAMIEDRVKGAIDALG